MQMYELNIPGRGNSHLKALKCVSAWYFQEQQEGLCGVQWTGDKVGNEVER